MFSSGLYSKTHLPESEGEVKNAHKILFGKPEGKNPLE
jgi:hypothetical protein